MIEGWAFCLVLTIAMILAISLAVVIIRWAITRGDPELRLLKAGYQRHAAAASSAAEKAVYAVGAASALRREVRSVKRREWAETEAEVLECQFAPASVHVEVDGSDIPKIPPKP